MDDHNESANSNNSSLQKSRSNVTTLERSNSKSPRPATQKPDRMKKLPKIQLSPRQLKAQLEQKILDDHKQNMKYKNESPVREQAEVQKTENKLQKFGVRVLPFEQQKSPKIIEQNDNNINIERYGGDVKSNDVANQQLSIDEVDRTKKLPENMPESPEPPFERQSSISGSGIKRDANGIPQEIPNHMLNAAVAARKNRKSSIDSELNKEELEPPKTPKKQKGKAPAPPEEKAKELFLEKPHSPELNRSDESVEKHMLSAESPDKDIKEYNSDSDVETDNQSSVNTIELNSSDITVHQSEETDDLQNRKTASTGDLTKIHRTKSGTGTLERAQSLDITDTGIPSLTKKRKAAKIEDIFDSKTNSDDSLYGNALIHKEPRLSLILDGLNTFQRSRLKKSTEWGNLEDAILKINKDGSESSIEGFHLDTPDGSVSRNFDFGSKSPVFDALVNKINEIKQETHEDVKEKEVEKPVKTSAKITEVAIKPERKVKNQIWPSVDDIVITEKKVNGVAHLPSESPEIKMFETKDNVVPTMENNVAVENSNVSTEQPEHLEIEESPKAPAEEKPLPNSVEASQDFLYCERLASSQDIFLNGMDDTNMSDDIKVSRHSLGSLEQQKMDFSSNVSNITINDKKVDQNGKTSTSFEISFDRGEPETEYSRLSTSELYTTALEDTIKVDEMENFERVNIQTPDLVKNINEVTIEGPTSLTLEIPGEVVVGNKVCRDVINEESGEKEKRCVDKPINSSTSSDDCSKSNSTLTYITEIQVTPNVSNKANNVSEIEIVPAVNVQNLDNKFENYVKNFEANVRSIESGIQSLSSSVEDTSSDIQGAITNEKNDAEKELHKIQEIVEEQLKKLPEMRFTTSSYEGSKIPEKRQSQIELLRSNFEKSPPKANKPEANTSKSRIPIATSMKTPPMSPERRDSRNLDLEPDKDILSIMSSPIHSTPAPSGLKYQSKSPSKNVTVTSIRTNSKIPSGLPSLSGSKPPVPPRRTESQEGDSVLHLSTNGSGEANNSFRQWVFNPSSSVTNIVVSEGKSEQK